MNRESSPLMGRASSSSRPKYNDDFVGLVKPRKSVPSPFDKLLGSLVLKDVFRARTLFVIGAFLQMGMSSVIPWPWSVAPAAIFGLQSIVTTFVQTLFFKDTNAFIKDVVAGRSTAQLPFKDTGRYGMVPAAQPLVVFHFGVRFNHPLGIFSPGGKAAGDRFRAMVQSLIEDRNQSAAEGKDSRYGLLGTSYFRGGDRGSHDTLLYVMYFQDVEGLQRFAHDPIHSEGFMWLRNSGHRHISAFHETFCVPAGAYETVYINTAPTLLGRTAVRCQQWEEYGDAEETVWMSPLVDASAARLRTMRARLNQDK